jgi:hypothetical protein
MKASEVGQVRFAHEIELSGVDEGRPLIYMWEIWSDDGTLVGRYVGKASKGSRRPLSHYKRNVSNILAGKPYRKGKPEGYRRVHRILADAVSNGHRVRLSLLRNVEPDENINRVERSLIEQHNSAGPEPWQLND